MARRPPVHVDRGRAEAFGLAAAHYDRYRPRYPQPLITELTAGAPVGTLDVGAGNGYRVGSADAGRRGSACCGTRPAHGPNSRKGIPVEQATFEEGQPRGRTFDLVVFAQSFSLGAAPVGTRHDHFHPASRRSSGTAVQPHQPSSPTRQDLDQAYAGLLDASARPAIDAAHDDDVMAMIQGHGYTVERRHVTEWLHYTTDDWVNLMCTYSNVLMLAPQVRTALRSRLQ